MGLMVTGEGNPQINANKYGLVQVRGVVTHMEQRVDDFRQYFRATIVTMGQAPPPPIPHHRHAGGVLPP